MFLCVILCGSLPRRLADQFGFCEAQMPPGTQVAHVIMCGQDAVKVSHFNSVNPVKCSALPRRLSNVRKIQHNVNSFSHLRIFEIQTCPG